MQKKFALAVMTACATLTALPVANARNVCPFVDHFMIEAPLPLRVLSAKTAGNLAYTQVNENYFRLSCLNIPSKVGGVAYLEIGMSDDLKCMLSIEDGPYNMNPSVTSIHCGGPAGRIYYIGMEHPFGSYNYTLKFTM